MRLRDDVLATDDLGRDGGVRHRELLVVSQSLEEHEHDHVGDDQADVDHRRGAAVGVVVAEREDHG